MVAEETVQEVTEETAAAVEAVAMPEQSEELLLLVRDLLVEIQARTHIHTVVLVVAARLRLEQMETQQRALAARALHTSAIRSAVAAVVAVPQVPTVVLAVVDPEDRRQ